MINAGQAVSDWAAVRFGKNFANNKFRDGSWAMQIPFVDHKHFDIERAYVLLAEWFLDPETPREQKINVLNEVMSRCLERLVRTAAPEETPGGFSSKGRMK